MDPIVIAVLMGIAAYIFVIALIPKHILTETQYTRSMLQKLSNQPAGRDTQDSASVLRQQMQKGGLLTRVFFTLPFSKSAYPAILKAGLANHIEILFSACLLIFVFLVYCLKRYSVFGIVAAFIFTYLLSAWFIKHTIRKRNATFLNLFPDALDMIVRSVRSGYPLNTAIQMVAENMQAPVSTEFKQVADEVTYGSSMTDALQRLSLRVDQPDIRFFVVVLAVQQDVGGSLSEVLSNLSGIIRKRKHLRLRIQALTSEGRATAWVLGSLPVVEALIINFAAPTHLLPLFNTTLGNMILAGSVGIVALGVFIVRLMINIKV